MAVAVPSSSFFAITDQDAVVIPKPSGLAVSDLMLVQLVAGVAGTISTIPSGFTLYQTYTKSSSLKLHVYYKIADSGDAAASTFTFTFTGTSNICGGGMLRITGYSTHIPIFTGAGDTAVNNTANPSFTNTITPAIADSLIVFMVGSMDNNASASGVSGYTLATSSPTFTEAYDNGNNTDDYQFSCAYGVRPQTTATGNSSITGGDSTSDWIGVLLAIPPDKDTILTDSVSMTDSLTSAISIVFLEVMSLPDSIVADTKMIWRNTAKHVSDWINPDK